MSRCRACNKRLTEYEATIKYASNGEFVDLCSRDLVWLDNVPLIERADLKSNETYHPDPDDESETEDQED